MLLLLRRLLSLPWYAGQQCRPLPCQADNNSYRWVVEFHASQQHSRRSGGSKSWGLLSLYFQLMSTLGSLSEFCPRMLARLANLDLLVLVSRETTKAIWVNSEFKEVALRRDESLRRLQQVQKIEGQQVWLPFLFDLIRFSGFKK